ncbi:MAG: class I SAM-dependent methyltransferase [Robiginitomaculum sp.]|nr:class I SAM-dependent methyltransferase [Robiginitomaculum sp.]
MQILGWMKQQMMPKTRELDVNDAATLSAGADHYRAYVGPPDRFDFMSATQFALLFQMGLRENHRVLDFGCGALRLGRLLIPFLRPHNYYGIDPNSWLIKEAINREMGRDILKIKSPHFDYNENYDCAVFGQKFDFIIAQSIVTHTGPDFTNTLFQSTAKTLKDDGLFLFSYIQGDPEEGLPDGGWHYPHCVRYSQNRMNTMLADAGLVGQSIPWHHPAASWHIAAKSIEAIPPEDQLAQITGTVIPKA